MEGRVRVFAYLRGGKSSCVSPPEGRMVFLHQTWPDSAPSLTLSDFVGVQEPTFVINRSTFNDISAMTSDILQ